MRRIVLLAIVLTCASLNAAAQPLAFNFSSPGIQDNGLSFAVSGFRFQVLTPITVVGLAAFDPAAPDGIASGTTVGLWADGGTLLASAGVSGGTLPMAGTYFCATGITPITLPAGYYRVAAEGPRTYVYGDPSNFAGFTKAPSVAYASVCYSASGTGFSFPNLADSGYSFLNVNLVLGTPTTPQPWLGITSVTNQIALCWPASATNYLLQCATNPSSPNWVTVTNGTPLTGVALTNTSPALFFRLQKF